MAVSPRTAEQVRLAIGMVTASEWDRENGGGLDTCRAYMQSCGTETAEDMIRGLVVLARAALGNVALREKRTLLSVLQDAARSDVACG